MTGTLASSGGNRPGTLAPPRPRRDGLGTLMLRPAVVSLLLSAVATAQAPAAQNQGPGYTDTPVMPNGWRVHDAARPRPRVVDPGPAPSQPVPAPADAVVLFDGRNLDAFTGRDGKAQWALVEGAMESNRTGDLETKAHFGDCQVHLEWAAPAVVKGESQGRGNSGVFFFGRYEVQVLDSYDNPTYADGQAAALYGQTPPLVNACRKPGEWQTYDLVFRAPRFAADGALLEPARVTVLHNGILVHHDQPMLGATAPCRATEPTRRRGRSSCRTTATRSVSATSGCANSISTAAPTEHLRQRASRQKRRASEREVAGIRPGSASPLG